MSDRPLIAVIVPAYNLAGYLQEALESVLAQTVPTELLDVVVIDDGSTDDTAAVAARFAPRVRCIRQSNRGLPAARNRGVAETSAPYLAFLDADDRLLPEKLADQLSILEVDRSAAVVYSGWHYIDEAGARLPQRGWSREEGDLLGRLLLGNLMHPHATLVRRSLFESVGGFDETLTSVEDWDLWIRISLAGARWRLVDHAALEYRVRGDGMHANPARMLANRLRVLDKVFPRLDSPALVALRPAAYRNAHLEAAADWARAAAIDDAIAETRAAARESAGFLTSPRGLRAFTRLLLPLGHRNESAVVAAWPTLGPLLRALARGAAADLGPLARHRRKRLLGGEGRAAA
jgi:glycosyltransferase involved in cell wall biosynthesis